MSCVTAIRFSKDSSTMNRTSAVVIHAPMSREATTTINTKVTAFSASNPAPARAEGLDDRVPRETSTPKAWPGTP